MFRSPELKILNERLLENYEKTEKDFREEVLASERLIEFMRTITDDWTMDVKTLDEKRHLKAILNLFSRSRQLYLSASLLFSMGCYGSSLSLQRIILENANLMRLFRENPEEVLSWNRGDEFHNWEVVLDAYAKNRKVGDQYRDFYRQLSNYIHPNSKGWTELEVPQGVGLGLLNIPRYLEDFERLTWGLLLLLGQLTLSEFVKTFADNISSEKKIKSHSLQVEMNKVLSKYVQEQ